jgi:hypothetical protein
MLIVLVVTPVPILFLLVGRPLFKVFVVAMGVVLPLVVVNRFAIPIVVVVVVRVIDACVDGATGDQEWRRERRAKSKSGEVFKEFMHKSYPHESEHEMRPLRGVVASGLKG